MKKGIRILIATFTGIAFHAHGQVYDPGNGGGAAKSPTPKSTGGDTNIVNQKKDSKSPYGS